MLDRVARYARMKARPGRGGEVATLLVEAADDFGPDDGCELYLVSQQADDPDLIWVTEVWRSQADLDDSLEQIRGSKRVAEVMALVENASMIGLDLRGGKGA